MWKILLRPENGIETCILSCKNRITSLCLMQDTACLGLVHGDDPERCYGAGVSEPMTGTDWQAKKSDDKQGQRARLVNAAV